MEQGGLGIALTGFLSNCLSGVHPVHSQQIHHDEPGDFSRLGRPLIIFRVHYPPPPLWVELNVCCRQAPVIGNGLVRQRGGKLRLESWLPASEPPASRSLHGGWSCAGEKGLPSFSGCGDPRQIPNPWTVICIALAFAAGRH